MQLYESIRTRQDDFINQNSASITISRTTRTASTDGGWTEATTTLTAQTVRIYAKNSRLIGIRAYGSDDGGWFSKRDMKMIARYNANLKAEDDTYLDKFTYGGKTYKIKDVKDIYTQGYIVFKECELEEMA